jgi:hypothetical protein
MLSSIQQVSRACNNGFRLGGKVLPPQAIRMRNQVKDATMSIVSMTGTETGRAGPPQKKALEHYENGVRETNSIENAISKKLIEFRSHQIESGWTSQQREERRRVGAARRAWLLSLVEPVHTI